MGSTTTFETGVEVQERNPIETAPRPPLPPGPYLVVGLGVAGRAAARALAHHGDGERVCAWDSAAEPAQRRVAEELRRLGVEVQLGGDGLDLLAAAGAAPTIVKSPGVPWEIPLLEAAAKRGLEVLDELDLAWRLVPAPTVAVTGTCGKSTVASLLVGVLAAQGMEPVLTGNTEFGPPLSELALGERPRSVVAEVSSYQAEASPALLVDGAVFTNLSPDHLARHGSMAAYAAAKRALFVNPRRAVPVAALNVDDELGAALAAELERRGSRALRYGRGASADYRVESARWGLGEGEVELRTPDGPLRLATRLPGAHHALNAAAVLALADGLGLDREPTLDALARTPPIPGRFEVLSVDRPFDVVVDYAYAEASVAANLATAREIVRPRGGRVIAVLGLVGRGAHLTAANVGRIAREGGDHLVLCGSSFRGEPRLLTLQKLAEGARAASGGELEIELDRRRAVARALAVATPGDIVLILGRGPLAREAFDLRGGGRLQTDAEIVRDSL